MCTTRYTEISMYVLLCVVIRFMEISMYLAMCFVARYTMFRRRRKLTEITSITDKFANRF